MAGSVREARPGVWEMRLHTGKDPLTGKKTQASSQIRASGKREAQAMCEPWAIQLADGDAVVAAGTFGDLVAQWIAVKQRRRDTQPLRAGVSARSERSGRRGTTPGEKRGVAR